MPGIADGSAALRGGFADPVFDTQILFRHLMDALARPGTMLTPPLAAVPPAPLLPLAGAIALTMADHDTPVWLDKSLAAGPAVAAWLAVQTHAPLADFPADAAFAFVADPARMPPLEAFGQGTQEYPDRSTTLVMQLPSLEGGAELLLSGPGIEDFDVIAPRGLPPHFVEQWAANGARFPRGVDLFLVADDGLLGLPRTVRMSKKGD